MDTSNASLSADELIRAELDGKRQAVHAYDDILWKIRTGYAVVLYGALSLLVGDAEKNPISFGQVTAMIYIVIIVGFSLFVGILDFAFMRSKFRVIDARDRIIELVLEALARDERLAVCPAQLGILLKNSGETRTAVDWKKRPGRLRLIILYGGTALIGVGVIGMIAN